MAITITNYAYVDGKHINTDEVIAVGTTLATWSDSVRVMSDMWEMATHAMYWTGEKVTTVTYAKNVTIDATPEVLEKVREFYYNQSLQKNIEKAKEEAAKIVKDAVVEVKRGRSNKGIVGKVVVYIMREYGMGYRSSLEPKIAIATSDRKVEVVAANGKVYENYADLVWVWARNVDLVNVPEINMEECYERAKEYANHVITKLEAAKAKPGKKVYF